MEPARNKLFHLNHAVAFQRISTFNKNLYLSVRTLRTKDGDFASPLADCLESTWLKQAHKSGRCSEKHSGRFLGSVPRHHSVYPMAYCRLQYLA